MTWLDITLIVLNVVTLAVSAWRFTGRLAELQGECDRAIVYHSDNAHRFSQAMRTNGFRPALLRQPASVAIAIARQTLRRIPRPWRKGA